jgi:hypothetical protein
MPNFQPRVILVQRVSSEHRAFVTGFGAAVPHTAVYLYYRRQFVASRSRRNISVDWVTSYFHFTAEIIGFSNFDFSLFGYPIEKLQSDCGLLDSSFSLQVPVVGDDDSLVGLLESRQIAVSAEKS